MSLYLHILPKFYESAVAKFKIIDYIWYNPLSFSAEIEFLWIWRTLWFVCIHRNYRGQFDHNNLGSFESHKIDFVFLSYIYANILNLIKIGPAVQTVPQWTYDSPSFCLYASKINCAEVLHKLSHTTIHSRNINNQNYSTPKKSVR